MWHQNSELCLTNASPAPIWTLLVLSSEEWPLNPSANLNFIDQCLCNYSPLNLCIWYGILRLFRPPTFRSPLIAKENFFNLVRVRYLCYQGNGICKSQMLLRHSQLSEYDNMELSGVYSKAEWVSLESKLNMNKDRNKASKVIQVHFIWSTLNIMILPDAASKGLVHLRPPSFTNPSNNGPAICK